MEGLPRVQASDSWIHVYRLFSLLVVSVNPIDVTCGKPDGVFLGHSRTPSRPASSGETPQAGQDCHNSMARDSQAAPVVQCALSERLLQLETATVAYAQGRCTPNNLYYSAYEKNTKIYEDYWQEGLLRAELGTCQRPSRGWSPALAG